MLSTPSKFQSFGEFFRFFIPSLTGVVGFWATVSLNIPDFTRYARSQRDHMIGHALGLPATMSFYSFFGIAVTSATLIIFGQALWDPLLAPSCCATRLKIRTDCVSLLDVTTVWTIDAPVDGRTIGSTIVKSSSARTVVLETSETAAIAIWR